MSLEDAIVALAADRALRRRFADAGVSALGDLDARSRRVLAELPIDALERYARSLVSKRWSDVARVVPLTCRIAPSIERRYREWLADHPAPPAAPSVAPAVVEALRALPILRAALARDEGEATYAPDLLSFEVLSACAREDGAPRILRTRFALHEIVADLRRGIVPIDPDDAPHEIRLERGGHRHRRIA
jgi:hypothetical protein